MRPPSPFHLGFFEAQVAPTAVFRAEKASRAAFRASAAAFNSASSHIYEEPIRSSKELAA